MNFSQHVFLTAFAASIAGEFGDKTQLLAVALSIKFRAPGRVLIAATLGSTASHFLVAEVGNRIGGTLDFKWLSWAVVSISILLAGSVFLMKEPRCSSEFEEESKYSAQSLFKLAILFFIAELGDKTQILTGALAAQMNSPIEVALGSSLGAVAPDAAAIFFGQRLFQYLKWRQVRWVSAGLLVLVALSSAVRVLKAGS